MKNYLFIKAFMFVGVLLMSISNSSAQSTKLSVKDGILYTVDGKWGNGIRLHYSSCKGNCKAKVNIEEGEHTVEYYLPKYGVFEISFIAKADNNYSINKGNPVEIKEGKEILKTATIKKVSVDKTEDEYIKLSSQRELAYLHWEADVKIKKASEFDYLLRKVDTVWGCNNMGYFNKGYEGNIDLALSPGEHTLSALIELDDVGATAILKEMHVIKYNFESGKKYKIVFDIIEKSKGKYSALEANQMMRTAHIVEIKE